MNITVVGTGYVGLANAILLAQHNHVVALDINPKVVEIINAGRPHIEDEYMSKYMAEKDLDLFATTDPDEAYVDTELVIVAAPTNYDDETNSFDISAVESVIDDVLARNQEVPILVKSTVPVGFTEKMREKKQSDQIIFSPEFLREGKALYDNLYPSRIIIGEQSERAEKLAELFVEGAEAEDIPVLLMDATEAEAVKLFSNTYLALRVSYFNELDTYAELKNLDTKQIIDGVGLDPRIGDHYNNPSFGYGGYCLPKDTKQLAANYQDVPNNLIRAIVKSNATRKRFISEQVIKQRPKVVGIHRLTMKTGSDNFRQAAIFDIMKRLRGEGIEVIIYEPSLDEETYLKYEVENDLETFKQRSDIILANRLADELKDVAEKVYTRDVYRDN